MGEQKETGRWKNCGSITVLSGCNSCEISEPLYIKEPSLKINLRRPFEYKYITIKSDSLYIIRPINKIDSSPGLVKRKG
jgi:hypothetical protein